MKKITGYSTILCAMIACTARVSENLQLKKGLESVTKRSTFLSDSVVDHSFVDNNGEKFLRYEMEVNASVNTVWQTIATQDGMEKWMAPVASIVLKAGGLVRTNYNKSASIGDPGTIDLNIINYIPGEMLIYKINLNDVFPEKCRDEDGNLQEIIQVKPTGENTTKITSTMVGWGEGKEWDKVYAFFKQGNRWSYLQLLNWFKSGSTPWH